MGKDPFDPRRIIELILIDNMSSGILGKYLTTYVGDIPLCIPTKIDDFDRWRLRYLWYELRASGIWAVSLEI